MIIAPKVVTLPTVAGAKAQRFADRNADESQEGSRIHAERNLVRVAGVHQQSNTLSGLRDCLVHFLRLPVSPASLNISVKKMVGYGVQHALGRLRTRGIIKENEI